MFLKTFVLFICGFSLSSLAQPVEDLAPEFGPTIPYLSEACSDGNERVGVFVPDENIFVDITMGLDTTTAEADRARLRTLCVTRKKLAIFHCHPEASSNIYLFPGFQQNVSSDLGFLLNVEYDCTAEAEKLGTTAASIDHFLVNTADNNKIVQYAVSDTLLEQTHTLAKKRVELMTPAPNEMSVTDLAKSFSSFNLARNMDLQQIKLEHEIGSFYAHDVHAYISDTCFKGAMLNFAWRLSVCEEATLESFVATITSDKPYRVWPYNFGTVVSTESTASFDNLSDGMNAFDFNRYPNVSLISPGLVESVLEHDITILVICGNDIMPGTSECNTMIDEALGIESHCTTKTIGVGFVDSVRHPEFKKELVMFPDELGDSGIHIYERDETFGASLRIRISNSARFDPKFHADVLCDFNIAWPSF